jgi:hypothetical protein
VILRRLTEHVRRQDWFAVFLDFVIVVLGVFVGIQVSNWNAARVESAQEMAMLSQLRDEIRVNDAALEAQTNYIQGSLDGGVRALAFLEGDEPCASNCADLLVDFFHASQLWGADYLTAVFRESERRGFPNDPETRAAVQNFYLSLTGWSVVNLTPPPYRERVRGHFSPAIAAALWDRCFEVDRVKLVEVLSRDCVSDLDAGESARILEAIRADGELAGMLRFWIGQNVFAIQEHPRLRADAAHAIAALTDRTGKPL